MCNKNKQVALVLGSGGARGLAHIGVIEELEKNGYTIAAISGCSIGAVIGGVYATGKLPDFKKWICNLDKYGVFNLMDFTLSKRGIIKGDKVFNELKKFIPTQNIEDLKIPFSAIAADIKSGSEVVFSKGDLYEAIRASVAIPSVLTPSHIRGQVLVDGGIVNPLPINRVDKSSAGRVIAVDLNGRGSYVAKKNTNTARAAAINKEESRWRKAIGSWFFDIGKEGKKQEDFGYFSLVNGSVDMMQARITELELAQNKPDVLIRVPKNAAGVFSFFKGEELIDYGREQARIALEKHQANA